MRPLTIFYLLCSYVILQFCWWAYLLANSSHTRAGMISGEGTVFLSLLLFGAYRLRKAINEEKALHQQQKNFLLSVTHELKSPLASIKLYIQTILKRDLEKEKQQGFLENSLKDIERLNQLVENMLIATQIESKSYVYQRDLVNLSSLTEEILQQLSLKIKEKRALSMNIGPSMGIIGDSFALSLVVNNLIENAIKYSDEGSIITISLTKNGPNIRLAVADEGKGVPDIEKQKIFDKFYRIGDEDTRSAKGTGLGLFIVKQITDYHGASIRVKNNQPTGSIFEILFPAAA